jgi:hypothetical protein
VAETVGGEGGSGATTRPRRRPGDPLSPWNPATGTYGTPASSAGTGSLYTWDPATGSWQAYDFTGARPETRVECHPGPDGRPDCRYVPVSPVTPPSGTAPTGPTGHEMSVGKSRAEVIAGHYATVGGRDVYVETDAERAARAAGLQRDQNGYYTVVNGQKVYQTGMEQETGRRYHYEPGAALDPFTGERERTYDDEAEFVTHGSRAELEAQRRAAQDKLEELRQQYKNSRGDSWVVRGNILDRIREVEDEVIGIGRVLGDDPVPEVTHSVSGTLDTKFKGGVRVEMDFAVDVAGQELSFSQQLSTIPNGAHVVARALIAFGDRLWTPGKLAQPDMFRVDWEVPQSWTALDAAPTSTDEFVCSNPVSIMRIFLAPSTGNTFVGKGTESVFKVRAAVYELVVDEGKVPEEWRKEGDDGYYGATIGTPGGPGSGDAGLAAFLDGLGWRESRNNPVAHNRHSGAWGEWQIMPTNWKNWCKELGLNPEPKTPEKAEALTVWRISKMFRGRQSWRRTANAWHKGPGWERNHQDHLGSYARAILNHAGLPID